MIFKPEMAAKVLSGEKTETRRPMKPGEPCRYKAGKSYAVQPGRGKHAIGRIRVTEVTWGFLGALAPVDARAEGFEGREDFLRYWHGLYGKATWSESVWVIRFELEAPATPPPRTTLQATSGEGATP